MNWSESSLSQWEKNTVYRRVKYKTNHPISSKNQTSASANKAIHNLKIVGGVTKPTGTSYNFDKV